MATIAVRAIDLGGPEPSLVDPAPNPVLDLTDPIIHAAYEAGRQQAAAALELAPSSDEG